MWDREFSPSFTSLYLSLLEFGVEQTSLFRVGWCASAAPNGAVRLARGRKSCRPRASNVESSSAGVRAYRTWTKTRREWFGAISLNKNAWVLLLLVVEKS